MKNKKIKRKHSGGFTLVECIVAMAILCVMSLLLMMIMSVTVAQRNKNMQLERDIDTQVMELAKDAPSDPTATASTEPVADNIVFSSGTWAEAIPADGSSGVIAKKKVYPNDNVALGALNYNFDAYNVVTVPSSGTGTGTDATPDPDSEIYGGCELVGTPTINKNDAQKQISISFTCKNHAPDKSMKYTLPEGVVFDSVASKTNAKVNLISDNVVRIEPSGSNGAQITVSVTIKYK